MQVVTNEKLAKSRFRLGTAFHLLGLLVLAAGLYLSLQADQATAEPWRVWAPWAAIVLFLVPNFLGKRFLQRYGPKTRQDAALALAAKGLDNRYSLVSFPGGGLPDYLLVGPTGVQVLVARAQSGTIVCRGDHWEREGMNALSRFAVGMWGTPLGNPTRDLFDGIARVKARLDARLGETAAAIPVSGTVVFTHPQARLRLEKCDAPATTSKNLKNHLRASKGTLGAPLVARTRDALAAEIPT
jgi:hypothetical protein